MQAAEKDALRKPDPRRARLRFSSMNLAPDFPLAGTARGPRQGNA
jgi:hypothetical protein